MCFSAEASFGASAVILTIGTLSMKRSKTFPQKVLSSIPIIFGVQQFVEGMLWLGLTHASLSALNKPAYYTFLVAAEVAWPVMLPLSTLLLEKNELKKKVLRVFLVLGVLVSAILGYCLIAYKVEASVSCYHILYDVSYPIHTTLFGPFYIIASVIPPFISSIKRLRLLGIVLVLSYAVTILFYQDYLISVWCFFATTIGIVILSTIVKINRDAALVAGVSPS